MQYVNNHCTNVTGVFLFFFFLSRLGTKLTSIYYYCSCLPCLCLIPWNRNDSLKKKHILLNLTLNFKKCAQPQKFLISYYYQFPFSLTGNLTVSLDYCFMLNWEKSHTEFNNTRLNCLHNLHNVLRKSIIIKKNTSP